MTTVDMRLPVSVLPSVYDKGVFSEDDFLAERDRVHTETAIERKWLEEAGLEPFTTDAEIMREAEAGRLIRVGHGAGFVAIDRLLNWEPTRSDPSHAWHYSTPHIRPQAFDFLRRIGEDWQSELGASRFLSVTSLARSSAYQNRLKQQERKLTIVDDGDLSSHQGLIAIDLDGCGIKEMSDDGEMRSINPRSPHWNPMLVAESRAVLRNFLDNEVRAGVINYVEELPGTQEHCFHICVNPTA